MNQQTKKILVADDDPAILDALKMILELEGYSVDTSSNGAFIYKSNQNYPDLLLLDIWMSGEDGRNICRYLKENPLTKHIPIILISASRDIRQSALDAGANDFLEKPFQMEDLLAIVSKYLP